MITFHDADTRGSTIEVGYYRYRIPRGVRPGSIATRNVRIGVVDNDEATVTLEASPNPVLEGEAVTVTARVAAIAGARLNTFPLTVSLGTAEEGDFGRPEPISIPFRGRSGSTTITTARDADDDDETFTVALGDLPPAFSRAARRRSRFGSRKCPR